jgi:hypothetical protein
VDSTWSSIPNEQDLYGKCCEENTHVPFRLPLIEVKHNFADLCFPSDCQAGWPFTQYFHKELVACFQNSVTDFFFEKLYFLSLLPRIFVFFFPTERVLLSCFFYKSVGCHIHGAVSDHLLTLKVKQDYEPRVCVDSVYRIKPKMSLGAPVVKHELLSFNGFIPAPVVKHEGFFQRKSLAYVLDEFPSPNGPFIRPNCRPLRQAFLEALLTPCLNSKVRVQKWLEHYVQHLESVWTYHLRFFENTARLAVSEDAAQNERARGYHLFNSVPGAVEYPLYEAVDLCYRFCHPFYLRTFVEKDLAGILSDEKYRNHPNLYRCKARSADHEGLHHAHLPFLFHKQIFDVCVTAGTFCGVPTYRYTKTTQTSVERGEVKGAQAMQYKEGHGFFTHEWLFGHKMKGFYPEEKKAHFTTLLRWMEREADLFDEPTNSDDDRLAKDEDEEKSLIPNFCGFEDRAYNPLASDTDTESLEEGEVLSQDPDPYREVIDLTCDENLEN